MPSGDLSDEQLLHHLNRHPHLKSRMQALIQVVEDADGDLRLADAAERRVIEEIRRLGQEALEAWAGRQVEKSGAALEQAAAVRRGGKKNSVGIRRSGTSPWKNPSIARVADAAGRSRSRPR